MKQCHIVVALHGSNDSSSHMNQFHGDKLVALLPLFFTSLLLSSGRISATISAGSLDSTIRDYAFKELHHRRTGILYQVSLPANLSGITSSVVRLRGRSLWINGFNLTAFKIPPRTMPAPYVRRLTVVYQNLGNWSSTYYNIPGYTLVSPVVGFLAYNASDTNAEALDFSVTGSPIVVTPVQVELPKGMNLTIKCAIFGRDGMLVQMYDIAALSSACSTRGTGHFAIVMRSAAVPSAAGERWWRRWWMWVACGGGLAIVLLLLGLLGMRIFRSLRARRIRMMEVRAEVGEVLGSVWVGGNKMPSAAIAMRTQPVLESATTP